MSSIDLSSATWRFFEPSSKRWLPANVPGCVHADLWRNRLIPDPFFGRNELNLQWIEEVCWKYETEFDVLEKALLESEIDLIFQGLDTFALVTLNDVDILRSENMFQSHRVSVKELLKNKHNRLSIVFDSAMHEIRTSRADFNAEENNDPVGGRYKVRKQQSQFGWDWGPRFVTAGIWRPISLEAWSNGRIETVHIRQFHTKSNVELSAEIFTSGTTEGVFYRAILSHEKNVVSRVESENRTAKLFLKNPKLWWPSGQGGQPLYKLQVELVAKNTGKTMSKWEKNIGLRTITLELKKKTQSPGTADSSRFGFRINGRLIFAKGANWIPAHSFVAGLNRERYEPLLHSAKQAHMNMIRLWGGGIYENDTFYELCDELGLLVWHDHMFACSLYPSDKAFVSSVQKEIKDNVLRIRHHACIALWCGNNENVMCNPNVFLHDSNRAGYRKLFLEAIPRILNEVDPCRQYIHSSPCYSIPGEPMSDIGSHDEHDWDVWHLRKPVESYLEKNHLFVSEFGMQSFPCLPEAKKFCGARELNILSPDFQNHQKNTGGNQVVLDYVMRLFRLPGNYGSLAYLSQLNQAICMKVAVEQFRRQQPNCLGALFWQLNDCWPVASWSSIEFGGRWKILHHFAKRFFAPSLISARHLGTETVTIGNYNKNTKGCVELWTSHDGPKACRAVMTWTLIKLDGEVLASGRKSVQLRPLESLKRKILNFSNILNTVGRQNAVLRLSLMNSARAILSEDSVLFAAPKLMSFSTSKIRTRIRRIGDGEWELILQTSSFQPAVWIEFSEDEITLTENAFDLYPVEDRTIKVSTLSKNNRKRKVPPKFIVRTIPLSAAL